MARRKNTRFIDPRWFMDEKMEVIKEVLKEDSFSDDAQKLTAAAAQRASKIAGKEVSPQELGKIGAQISAMIYHGKLKMPDPATVRGETDVDKFIDAWVNQNAYPQLDKFIQGEMQRLGAKKQPAQPSAQPAARPATGAQKSAGYDKQAARFQENLGGGADMAKAEELAATFQKSPAIMAAVEQAMQDPEVQKALEQATAGGLQEEEDPYADDPVGAAYQKKAQLAGAGEAASAGVAAVGAGAVLGPGILTALAGKMVVTGAVAALGIAGGAALMGLALIATQVFMRRRSAASQKAKGYGREVSDFTSAEYRKIHGED